MGWFAEEHAMCDWLREDDGSYEYEGAAPYNHCCKRCNNCGTEHLQWILVGGKWRLATRVHVLHKCPPRFKPEV